MTDGTDKASGHVWPDYLTDAVKAAMERHDLKLGPGMVPGFAKVEVRLDVRMPKWITGKLQDDATGGSYVLHPNVYHVEMREGGPLTMYALNAADTLEDVMQHMQEDGTIREQFELKLNLVPVMVGERERPLTFDEVLVWVAVGDALEDGDTEAADRLVMAAYPAIKVARERKDAPPLEALKAIRHFVPVAKSTWALTNSDIGESFDLAVGKGKRGEQLRISFGTDWDEETRAELRDGDGNIVRLNREHLQVIAAVATLMERGNRTVTPFQLCEVMGLDTSRENRAHVHGLVMQLRAIDGHIDWTAQARAYKVVNPDTGLPFDEAKIYGHLVEAQVFYGRDTSGEEYVRYQLIAEPPTYKHAKMLGQVVEYPQRLKSLRPIDESGKESRMTREQVAVADYVLQYVYQLKNQRNGLSPTVGYDTIIANASVDGPDKTDTEGARRARRRRMVRFIDSYLRALQAAGEIRGFNTEFETGRGRAAKSVTIVV